MIIRQAEEKDIARLAELDGICFSEPWSEESFRQEITKNDVALYIVAEIDGEVIGYAGMWLILDEGHITNVAVHPDFRRRHIAEAILTVLLGEAEAAGALRQTLEVRRTNFAAQTLYRKFGFEEAGVRKGYYEDNHEDALIYWRG